MSSDYEKYIQQQAKERDEFFIKYPEAYEKQQLQRQQRFMELKAKREKQAETEAEEDALYDDNGSYDDSDNNSDSELDGLDESVDVV